MTGSLSVRLTKGTGYEMIINNQLKINGTNQRQMEPIDIEKVFESSVSDINL